MNELVSLVQERLGIGEDKSQMAVNLVIGYLKDRLPPQLRGYLDSVLAGQDLSQEGTDLLSKAGDLFGKK